jgi:hypothetical protein
MTEAEWLAGKDFYPMLKFMDSKIGLRKGRLLACACCRRLEGHLRDERSREAITVAEQYADGLATKTALRRGRQAVRAAQEETPRDGKHEVQWNAYGAVAQAATEKDFLKAIDEAWIVARSPATGIRVAREPFPANLLREIIGNPFRLARIDPIWLTWNDATVRGIAQAIYDERGFDRMPILADALTDAGCDCADILAHCRQPGEHVRGCWVVDLILSKDR